MRFSNAITSKMHEKRLYSEAACPTTQTTNVEERIYFLILKTYILFQLNIGKSVRGSRPQGHHENHPK